jgi:hypothetical protein
MILWDDTQDRIAQKSTFHAQDIQTAEAMFASATEKDRSQLTAAELELSPAWQILRRLVQYLGGSPQKNESSITHLIDSLTLVVTKLRASQNTRDSESRPFLHWHTIHDLMLRIEFFRACRKLGEANASSAKSRKQSTSPTYTSFQVLVDAVREAQTQLSKHAEALAAMLSENTMVDNLQGKSKGTPFGQELCLFFGEEYMKTAATSTIESARSSLHGVIAAAKL